MKVYIVSVRKPRDVTAWEEKLWKKIQHGVELQHVVVAPEGNRDERVNTEREGERILTKLEKIAAHRVACDERGTQMGSVEWSEFMYKKIEQRGAVCLVVGGANGLSEAVKAACESRLSLGKMVWTHDLARLMVTEQVYRAVMIRRGGRYHK